MSSVIAGGDQRLAVIELGSRAIRLLVADVTGSNGLRPVDAQVRRTEILEALKRSERELVTELVIAAQSIDELKHRAARQGATKVAVFGTESIRKTSTSRHFAESGLADCVDFILTGRQEALCSIVAGSITLGSMGVAAQRLVVIDHGAGSLEVAIGQAGQNHGLEKSVSVPLGGSHLLAAFRTCKRDLDRLRGLVRLELDGLAFDGAERLPVVVMGTVATKCAWLTKRRGKADRYDPKRVEGVQLSLDSLRMIYDHAKTLNCQSNPEMAWDGFQEFINPGEHGGDAAERVATGVIPIIEVLSDIGADAFYVSALGTRHGFAMLWANSPSTLDV